MRNSASFLEVPIEIYKQSFLIRFWPRDNSAAKSEQQSETNVINISIRSLSDHLKDFFLGKNIFGNAADEFNDLLSFRLCRIPFTQRVSLKLVKLHALSR